MAKKLKGVDGKTDDEAPVEHNSKARKQIIRECADEMRGIKAQRKELSEQASDIRERLRNAGIDVKSFEAALRLVDMDDSEARNVFMDGLSEAWEAIGIGGQLDWIDAAEKAEEDVRPRHLRPVEDGGTRTEVPEAA